MKPWETTRTLLIKCAGIQHSDTSRFKACFELAVTKCNNFDYKVRTRRFHLVKQFAVAPSIFNIFLSKVADMLKKQ